MIGDDTHAWRRDLPHLQKSGKTYAVTFVTRDRRELSPRERDITLSCLIRSHRRVMYLHAAVVMSDHVHILCTPYERITLARLMQLLKSMSAHLIAKGRSIWQREYFDRIVRSDEDVRRKCEYILANPVRAGLVESIDDYRWIWRWWVDDARGAGEDAGAPPSWP